MALVDTARRSWQVLAMTVIAGVLLSGCAEFDPRHLEQIGSVTAEEINETAQWLAELTNDEDLPQKLLMIHQFTFPMVENRTDIDTSHDELAVVLQTDGHGSPELKESICEQLQTDLPEGIWMGWKNFYNEDDPMFSPEETYQIEPQPWFVSYQ